MSQSNLRSGWASFPWLVFCLLLLALISPLASVAQSALPAKGKESLELTRAARPWEFLAAVGKKASLLGNESGAVEAWVYPVKILRDFRLTILTEGREIPAETLVRTVTARPESTTLVYTGDTFSVRETFFVPSDSPGAIIKLEIETEQPLQLRASFIRDFQLEWPAAMGGTYIGWSDPLHAFIFGEDHQRFAAIAGSPSASGDELEYETNYGGTRRSSMKLGLTAKGRDVKLIVIAGSINGRAEAEKNYQSLSSDYARLWQESAAFYSGYLQETASIELPDADLQRAYDWSRISLIQGLVSNPTMGDGLIAGYRTSGEGYRPGFAWFFGRDSLWCDLALNAEGDFATTKTALEFIAKFQREDGKIPHEIAQGASFVDWFKGYPYAYASADATPLYIVATDDYVSTSGDIDFAKASWEHLRKAYAFLRSTYDAQGFPRNFGFGHGWIEGGPLLPVESEFYQSGLAVAAIRALAHLSELTGHPADVKSLNDELAKEQKQLNEAFWSPDKKFFAYAMDRDVKRVDVPTVLTTVPMWFGLTDEDKSQQTIAELAKPEHQTDWGMRIISEQNPLFSGGGYHYGSVWPLFTGWASVAEYRYHRPQSAYDNLRANALLALDGSPGHVTEVLSGDYYQPLSASSPHQIWSAAMVINPMLRGLFGLQTDATSHTLVFAPHVPENWTHFSLQNIRVGSTAVWINYTKGGNPQNPEQVVISFAVGRVGGQDDCTIEFRPAISPRATVIRAELDGKPVSFRMEAHATDQHVVVRVSLGGRKHLLRLFLANDFGFGQDAGLPALGEKSRGLRIISESWSASKDQLTLVVSGKPGTDYALNVSNPGELERVEGDGVEGRGLNSSLLTGGLVAFTVRGNPAEDYRETQLVFHFDPKRTKK